MMMSDRVSDRVNDDVEITITVDTDDADYVTSSNIISQEDLSLIMPLIESIKQFTPYRSDNHGCMWTHHNNFPYGRCRREDLGEISVRQYYYDISDDVVDEFIKLCPYTEYGFHTIHSITISPLVEKIVLI